MNKLNKLAKDLLMEKFNSSLKSFQIVYLPVLLKKGSKINSQLRKEMKTLFMHYREVL